MSIGTDVWLSLAIQIPVVLLFCIFMGYIVRLFLSHIDAQEERSRLFIKEQREANNASVIQITNTHAEAVKALALQNAVAVREVAAEHKTAMERLTDGIRDDLNGIAVCLSDINAQSVGHDAFVRTAFKERFGMATMGNAEAAAQVAEAQAAKR